MAETHESNYTSGLMLGIALALLIAVIVYAVILPQRRGAVELPEINVETEAPSAPSRPVEPPAGDHLLEAR